MMKTKIGILKPGAAPEKLAAAQGDYDALFRELLGDTAFDYITYDVEKGVFPDSAMAADGWIITGSRHGVYEDHDWIAPLEGFIREIEAKKRPLVGICFGHQIIAQALGGRVERAASGWIVGPQRYTEVSGREFFLNAWHQDQVVEAPVGARLLASGEGCSIAALRYPGPILTLQPHPEFSLAYIAGLLDERGAALPERLQAKAAAAIKSGESIAQGYAAQIMAATLKSQDSR